MISVLRPEAKLFGLRCLMIIGTEGGLQDRRIGPIAYRAGFKSIAAFNRAFREAYGETPRSVRKPETASVVPMSRGRMGVLTRWLLEIS
jgi:AraC-like DNA-binding protein